MQTKVCKKCGVDKPLNLFHKSKTNKYGVATTCIECRSRLSTEQKEALRERESLFKEGLKKCTKCSETKKLEGFYKSYQRKDGFADWCKNCVKIYERTGERGEKRRRQKREYNKTDAGKKTNKRRHDRESFREYNRSYKKRDYVKKKEGERRKNKVKENISFKIGIRLHSRLNIALKRGGKTATHRTEDVLGCTVAFFKSHIESLFSDGMTWNNWSYYGWHLDHIIPCRAFTLTNPVHKKACFNWRNYQPMWGRLNLKKGFKYSKDNLESYLQLFI